MKKPIKIEKIIKEGNNEYIVLPSLLINHINVKEGDTIELYADENTIILRPKRKMNKKSVKINERMGKIYTDANDDIFVECMPCDE